MKNSFLILTTALLSFMLFACSKDEVKQEDIALQAAKAYYDQLIAGDYNAFVEGSAMGDSIPERYKEQLLLNARMYIEQQNKLHQGIVRTEAVRAVCDTTKLDNDSILVTAQAFIAICYKDSAREEIVIPMIRKNNLWYMK